MIKKASFFIFLFCISSLYSENIVGFWKTRNDKTGKPQSIIGIYEYQNRYYGRIIGSYDEEGKMDDTIYDPIGRANAVQGDPYFSGLDIVWVNKRGNGYQGTILDPRNGSTYRVEITRNNNKLFVKGKLLFFSGTRVWTLATPSDFPKDFKMPDLSTFVPSIPRT